MTGNALIIGYGNKLRSDDGIGQAVAQAIADDTAPIGRVIVCHQLTPELAESIAAADLVVFADAIAGVQPGSVAVRKLQPTSVPSSGLGHVATAEALLDLARTLYGRCPDGFLVTVGAASFALGDELSAQAASALPKAVASIRRLVADHFQED